MRPVHIFRKPCLISLRRLAVVRLKSAACKYWDISGFEVCARMLCTKFSYCCVPRGTSHIPVFLFLISMNISPPLFLMDISCLFGVMVHPSSYKTPHNINGAVCIFGKMWICLTCLIRPSTWSVAMFVDSIMIPFGNLAFIPLSIITEAIVGVACFATCIFTPESAISSMLLLFGLGGVSI